jgi:hypothetical protein
VVRGRRVETAADWDRHDTAMTDDNSEADELRSRDDRSERTGEPDFEEWSNVPTDPNSGELGYEVSQWDRIPTAEDGQVVFLPGNEEDLKDDAFVVLEESDLCDLVTRR